MTFSPAFINEAILHYSQTNILYAFIVHQNCPEWAVIFNLVIWKFHCHCSLSIRQGIKSTDLFCNCHFYPWGFFRNKKQKKLVKRTFKYLKAGLDWGKIFETNFMLLSRAAQGTYSSSFFKYLVIPNATEYLRYPPLERRK